MAFYYFHTSEQRMHESPIQFALKSVHVLTTGARQKPKSQERLEKIRNQAFEAFRECTRTTFVTLEKAYKINKKA